MKKICFLFLLLLLLSSCTGKPGTTENVVVTLGDSERFSKEELRAAADCVIEYFGTFRGCDLLTIVYDEEVSDSYAELYDSSSYPDVTVENVVVFLSDFYVDDSEIDNGFEADTMQTGWSWSLEKDPDENSWKIFSYGYG